MHTAQAHDIAEDLYEGRLDLSGQPEFAHLHRVALAVPEDCRVAAYLHDVVEDDILSLGVISCLCSPQQLIAIALLTRPKGATYMDYIRSIAFARLPGSTQARQVKLADLTDNMTRDCPPTMLSLRGPGGRYDRARRLLQSVA